MRKALAFAAAAVVVSLATTSASPGVARSCGWGSAVWYVVRADGSGCRAVNVPFTISDFSRDRSRVLGFGGSSPGTVYSARLDGSDVRVILTQDLAAEPRWSPDGRSIAYTVSPGCITGPVCGNSEIWVADADGGNRRRVTEGFTAPVWSPDSKRLLFVSAPHGGALITIVRADGAERRELGYWFEGACPIDATWSPNGRRLAYVSNDSIYVARSDGRHGRLLEPGCSPSWSPTGRRIAFMYGPQLTVMNSDGRRVRELAYIRGLNSHVDAAAWSPTGRSIAYAPHRENVAGPWHEYVDLVRPSGSGRPRRVTRAPDCSYVREFRWFPGAKWLLFSLESYGPCNDPE